MPSDSNTRSKIIFVLIPIGVAVWILASHTVGESIKPRNSVEIGFAVALLAVVGAGYILLSDISVKQSNPQFGVILICCGTACMLLALLLQFYLAHIASEHGKHVAEIMADNLKRGQSVHVDFDTHFPATGGAIAYLALLVGTWLAAVGIHIGVHRQPRLPSATEEIAA